MAEQIIARRTFRYRLYPTKAQVIVLDGQLALCCELFNAAAQERRDAWRLNRKSISFRSQSDQLPEIKVERPDIGEVYSQVLQDVLHRLDKAFQAFFRRVKTRQSKAGFPRFCPRARYHSLTYPQLGFSVVGRHLKLSKIGHIKIKLHRPIEGIIKTVTVARAAGRWYACFSVQCEPKELPRSLNTVGVDVGLAHFATLSDGSKIENPRWYQNAQKELKAAQRKVARRKKGSRRKCKAIQLLQRAHARVRNQRADFHHKVSFRLVKHFGLIAVEDLNVKGMVKNRRLSRAISDAAWSTFTDILAYKAGNAGRVLVKVDPRGTSQTCTCGAKVRKTLAQRWHLCLSCGLSADRDHVSAQIILGLGLSLQAPREAVASFA